MDAQASLKKVLAVLQDVHPEGNAAQWEVIRQHISEHASSTLEEKLKDVLGVLKGTHTEKNKEAWATIRKGCEEILQANAGFEASVKSLCKLLSGIHPTDTNFKEWEAIRNVAGGEVSS
jgi:hypothetical protein